MELTAAAIDDAALSAGSRPLPQHVPLPAATWRATLRARRMRVFDWMVDAGFRLLNVLPDSGGRFLAFADQFDLHDKYSVARNLWLSMRTHIEDDSGWLNAIAATEILLVELRQPRPFAEPPVSDSDAVTLPAGVRLVEIEPDTLALHESIPEFSLPAAIAAEELARLRRRFPQRPPAYRDALFVPGCGEEPEGRLVQIEAALAPALSGLVNQKVSLAQLRQRIGPDTVTALVSIGAIARCAV
jgi:hypothetical protein